jgi:hypothetical protein
MISAADVANKKAGRGRDLPLHQRVLNTRRRKSYLGAITPSAFEAKVE